MRTLGLRTQIWNNALKSVLLLASFPIPLLLIVYGMIVLDRAVEGQAVMPELLAAADRLPVYLPLAIVVALVWFAIAFQINIRLIEWSSGARPVTREQEPRLHNLLENLCISRGLGIPKLCIIEQPELNAFAAGVNRRQYMIAVTRGLVDTLDEAELEAVLGHELSHIRNGDTRLMVVAAVFVGILALVMDLFGRYARGAGPLVAVATACFVVGRVLAVATRLALSRRREFMADAGAVELTRNPDAMISALRKIEGRSTISGLPTPLRPMLVDGEVEDGFWNRIFATHPTIAERIEALVAFAGGHDPGPRPAFVLPDALKPGTASGKA